MSELTIVGIGPGPIHYLTAQAKDELLKASKVFFRFSQHPVYHWLKQNGKHVVCFDFAYTISKLQPVERYKFIASAVIKEAELRGQAVYALPGNPCVGEMTTPLLRREGRLRGINVRIIPGISFLELMYAELSIDPTQGIQIVLPRSHLEPSLFSVDLGIIICLIEASNVALVKQWMLEKFPSSHPVTLVWTSGMPDYELGLKTVALADLLHGVEKVSR